MRSAFSMVDSLWATTIREEKEEVWRRYEELNNEINHRRIRSMLIQFDPLTFGPRWNWPLIAEGARRYLELASRRREDGASSRDEHFCYHFVARKLHEIDERTWDYLQAVQEVGATGVEDLAARLESRGCGDAGEVAKELRSVVERYVLGFLAQPSPGAT